MRKHRDLRDTFCGNQRRHTAQWGGGVSQTALGIVLKFIHIASDIFKRINENNNHIETNFPEWT